MPSEKMKLLIGRLESTVRRYYAPRHDDKRALLSDVEKAEDDLHVAIDELEEQLDVVRSG